MNLDSKIFVAGHNGLVGSAIVRKLEKEGYKNIIKIDHSKLDLTRQEEVEKFFSNTKPEYVFLAGAKVGGILANSLYPADFIYQNIMIESNIINQCYIHNIKKLLYLASSCIYPKLCPQPIKEEYLLSGYLEPSNDAYAIAKIAGIKMCQSYNKQYGTNFISIMPTNLYGKNDHYDLKNSHVLPALIKKFHDAKINNNKNVNIWGTGKPMREFLYVDDLADALLFLMLNYNDSEIINVGTGKDISIENLAILIKKIVEYDGDIVFDTTKPDGTPKKLLDVTKLEKIGWKYSTELEDGIKETYRNYITSNK